MKILLCVALSLLLVGCSSPLKDKMERIQVGMTYEEVENIVGKPVALLKGSTAVRISLRGIGVDSTLSPVLRCASKVTRNDSARARFILTSEEIANAYCEEISKETGCSVGARTIYEGAQLLETTWEYDISKVETTYYFLRKDTLTTLSGTLIIDAYFLNNETEIDESSYLKTSVGDWVYLWENTGRPYSLVKVNSPMSSWVEVKSLNVRKKNVSNRSLRFVELPSQRVDQTTMYRYRIVFDSSSGRVKSKGLQPILVL
jgi:hypothetical protein